ncbi:metallophosphoesterase [Nocardioides luteus]|nr:metallophosphoesterase [Nocardioides luteus]
MAQGDDARTGSVDWARTKAYLHSDPTKWNSLSWITARTLVDSVNDVLGKGTQGLVEDLRTYWTKKDVPLTIPAAGVSRFLVIGDTGEQDPSQYVVAPALARAARGRSDRDQAGFVLVLSDVIYPSGNVNDYVDGFYKPYRSNRVEGLQAPAEVRDEFALPENVPVYAVPGNHDWYDGLYGFAHQFLYAAEQPPTWPGVLLAPSFDDGLGLGPRIRDRFGRIMWRTPSEPDDTNAPARWGEPEPDGDPAPEAQLQPAPYFVIETEHVRLVCIDTGIDGSIDQAQMDWLTSLGEGKPKILMTGKPLVVNGGVRTCSVPGEQGTVPDPVYRVVADPAQGFVATIGGDTHNFQLYEPPTDTQTGARRGLWHIVTGGGGAYTHATHPIRTAEPDPRVETTFPPTQEKLFPRSHESLSFFAQQLVPSIWRLMLSILFFGAGLALGTWFANGGWARWTLYPSGPRVGPGGVAVVAMMALVMLHLLPRRPGRTRFWWRLLFRLDALVAGVLATLFLHQVLPDDDAEAMLWLYVTCTLWVCLNAWVLRMTRWWNPVDQAAGWWKDLAFLLTVVALAALAAIPTMLDVRSSEPPGGEIWLLVVALVAYLVVMGKGWLHDRNVGNVLGDDAARWLNRSVWWATGAQAAVVAGEMLRVMSDHDLPPLLFWSGLLSLLPLVVIAAVIVGLMMIPDLRTRHIADLETRRNTWIGYRGWVRGAVLAAAPVVMIIWAAAAYLLNLPSVREWIGTAPAAVLQACFGLPALLVAAAVWLFISDWMRRDHPAWHRRLTVVGLLVAGILLLGAAVPGLLDGTGPVPSGIADWLRTSWPAVAVGAALFITIAVGFAILLAHLVFLGAYSLFVDPKAWFDGLYRDGPGAYKDFISEQDAKRIIQAERDRVGAEPAAVKGVGWWAKRRAYIAFPGLNPPFGPIQRFVSEIYSLDEPPFFKHFLEFQTSSADGFTDIVVKIHRVRGYETLDTDDPDEEVVASIRIPADAHAGGG